MAISLLSANLLFAQGGMMPGPGTPASAGGGGGAVPTFVNGVSGSNIRTDTLTTKTWDTSTCPSGTYCTHLPKGTLNGNFILADVLYADSPGSTILVTDDKAGGSSTYTLIGTPAHNSTNGYFLAFYYAKNVAAGIKTIFVNSTAAVAHVSARTQQLYNVDQTSPIRSSGGNAGANGSTTLDAGSVTPNTGDIVLYTACRTQTPAATSFTKGSQAGITWAKRSQMSDIIQGCFSQWGIYTGSGAFTPTASTSGGSGYVAFAVALVPAAAGTAPTGMYIAGIEHQEIVAGAPVTTTHEWPCTGNLQVVMAGGGGKRWITNIVTSPSLSWTSAGTETDDGNNTVLPWYAANSTACTGDLTATVTWNEIPPGGGTNAGDNTLLVYDIVGAAAAPFRYVFSKTGTLAVATPSMFTTDLSQQGYQTLGPQPGITDGMLFAEDIHNLNTGVALTSPSSGSVFDAIAYGGQSLDGASTDDQNNDWANATIAVPDIVNWTWGFAQSNEDPGNYAGALVSFLSATGSIVPRPLKGGAATLNNTTTTNTLSYTPTAASHTLAIQCSINNTAAGVTDITLANSLGDTVTNVGAMTTVTGVGKFRTFYVKTASAGASTHTCTYTGTSSTHRKNILIFELDGVDQTNPVDVSSTPADAAEDGSGNFCSNNVTNTSTNDLAVAMAYCGGGVCNNVASVGAGYNYGFEEINQSKALTEWKIVNSTSTFNACAVDQGIAGRAGMTVIVFKGGS